MALRIGVVGAGGNARMHLRRFLTMPDVEIAGLADPSQESLAATRAAVAAVGTVPTFAGLHEMLAAIELEAVLIATPHALHYEQIVMALQAGLHVLAEKPLVHTAALARQILEHVAASGREVVVGFQRRFTPEYRHVRALVRDGRLGSLRHISGMQAQGWMRATEGTWRRSRALGGGGQLSDSGSHLLDILLWTSGRRVVEVDARLRSYGGEVEVDAAAILTFDDGAIGSVSIIGSAQRFWERFALIGSEGAVRVDYAAGHGYQVTHEDPAASPEAAPTELPPGTDPDAHFVAVVRGEVVNQSPPTETVHLLEVIEAMRASGKIGRAVTLGDG